VGNRISSLGISPLFRPRPPLQPIFVTTDQAPALETRRLSKRYGRGGVLALDAVDVSIPEGSITALVGPNGAGKTTLIRCWLGFERPTAGSALVGGVDAQLDRKAVVDTVGYVSQSTGLYRGLSVNDHLQLASSLRPGFDRQAAAARLDQFEIPLRQGAGTLSGGQATQLAIAIALGTHAPVLLLDEPLAALDPLARHELLNVLHDEVRARGATAVLSSHIVSDVAEVCERIVVLARGRVMLDGRIDAALGSHRLAGDATPGPATIAAIVRPGGERRWLVRSDSATLPQPKLEELVMGYLAASRDEAHRDEVAA
jgi:ABC-2 type transport system ATP-binding protein